MTSHLPCHLPCLLTIARLTCAGSIAMLVIGLFPGSATSSTRPAQDLFNPAAQIDRGQIEVWN